MNFNWIDESRTPEYYPRDNYVFVHSITYFQNPLRFPRILWQAPQSPSRPPRVTSSAPGSSFQSAVLTATPTITNVYCKWLIARADKQVAAALSLPTKGLVVSLNSFRYWLYRELLLNVYCITWVYDSRKSSMSFKNIMRRNVLNVYFHRKILTFVTGK